MSYSRLNPNRWTRRSIFGISCAIILVATLVPIHIRLFADYIFLIPGKFGFEWTERYGSAITCNDTEYLLTRMCHLGSTKYVPVLRKHRDNVSYILWNHTDVAYNPTLACIEDKVHIIGSANSEVHFTSYIPVQDAPVYMMSISGTSKRSLPLPMDSCIEHYFEQCEFDSKFSFVHSNGTMRLYIRANMNSTGGSRHVQFTESVDNGTTWSKFQLINIQGYTLRKENNIYFFDVEARGDAFIARYPAVFRDEGGIYQSESTDGRVWSRPYLIVSSTAYGERTTLHPIGTNYAMRINLLFRTNDVEIFKLHDGRLEHNGRFDTSTMV